MPCNACLELTAPAALQLRLRFGACAWGPLGLERGRSWACLCEGSLGKYHTSAPCALSDGRPFLWVVFGGEDGRVAIRCGTGQSGPCVGEAHSNGAGAGLWSPQGRPPCFFHVSSGRVQVAGLEQIVDGVLSMAAPSWCGVDGSTIDNFLEIFRDQASSRRPCVIADFFSGKGRVVQMRSSIRHLEASCRLFKAIRHHEIEDGAGHALYRLLFAQTGWHLLEPG